MELPVDFLLLLASVILISLSAVMTPGPLTALAIAKGYENGKAGVFIACGHGVIEFPIIYLIYLGLIQIFTSGLIKTVIGLLGGTVLIYMGVQMFKSRGEATLKGKALPYNPLIGGMIATITNPYFFLWWATVGVDLGLKALSFGFSAFLLFSLTHWSCDLFWDALVSLLTFKSKSLWTERTRRVVFSACSITLVGIGLWFIVSVL